MLYKIVNRLSLSLVAIEHEGKVTLWKWCALRKRRVDNCVICSMPLDKFAYRPLINTYGRGKRICPSCIKNLL